MDLEVKDFPCIVTMDSHGDSLHEEVQKGSKAVLDELLGKKKGPPCGSSRSARRSPRAWPHSGWREISWG